MPKTKKTSKLKKRKALIQIGWEFIKLQLAGNVPFWGTYLINYELDQVLNIGKFQALLIATILANAMFFVVDDLWVFNSSRRKRKTTVEIWRFIIFMSFSAFLVFNITWNLYSLLHISTYIGQFISAGISTLWTFIGLRFWVFTPPRHHGLFPPRAIKRA